MGEIMNEKLHDLESKNMNGKSSGLDARQAINKEAIGQIGSIVLVPINSVTNNASQPEKKEKKVGRTKHGFVMSNAQRQSAFRAKKKAEGYRTVSLRVTGMAVKYSKNPNLRMVAWSGKDGDRPIIIGHQYLMDSWIALGIKHGFLQGKLVDMKKSNG